MATSLEEQLAIAQDFGITLAALEKHASRCKPLRASRRATRVDEAAPESGPREAPEPPPVALPPARELAAPDEELRRRRQLLTRHLEREDLEPRHVSQVSNALATLDRVELAREKADRPIHEHPDFEGLVEDLVDAVVGEVGPGSSAGIEGRVAERFERLQAARAGVAPVRRAA